jgi:hypothetical protein
MKLDRILLLIAGILGITAFFLPFMHLVKLGFIDVNLSGANLFQALLEAFELGEFRKGEKIYQFLADYALSNEGLIDWAGFAGLLFVLLGPLYFLVFGITYLIKGLRGIRGYQRGLVFLLLYTLIAFVGIYFGGQYYKLKINFFNRAGLGYWLAAGGIVLAFLSQYLKPRKSVTV